MLLALLSSMAMITNTLRDLSQTLFASWRVLFGDESAVARVKTLFPRCIAERWGSIDLTESRMLKADISCLSQAVSHMFQVSPELNSHNDRGTAEGQDVDALATDDSENYKRKIGKWRTHTVNTLRDPLVETVAHVIHHVKGPFIHLSNFLKKKLPVDSDGHLFRLVCGKADDMFAEFDDMLF